MNKLKEMLPYLIPAIIAFYLLPLLGKNTGAFMLILLVITPAICFISASLYGSKRGFELVYSLMIGLLFIPTIAVYYNSSAWIYIVIYTIVALIGNVVGGLGINRSGK